MEKKTKTIQTIYAPRGAAGQYSPLGLNPYTGCAHKCIYCYQKLMMKRFHPEIDFTKEVPRPVYIESLERTAPKYRGCQMITLSFGCDPYCKLNDLLKLTRQSLQILLKNENCVAILSKAGSSVIQDTDVILPFGEHIMVGTTLTTIKKEDSLKYEPGAALPADRIAMLKHFFDLKVDTWASFEPVISTEVSLELMELSAPYCNKYKIGKLNHFPGLERKIDWSKFLDEAVCIMRKYQKQFIIKADLLSYNKGTHLFPKEIDPRSLDVPPFIKI